MRVALCGGGTGGHVYPALTVAEALREMVPGSLEMLYVGVRGRMDAELVAGAGIGFRAVRAAPLRVGSPLGMARGALAAGAGTVEAVGVLRRFRPHAVFATGGFGSVGVGLAAWLLRCPLLLFLPDVEAGLAVRALARVAKRIAVSTGSALDAMAGERAFVSGYPVRRSFFEAERDRAREELGLDPALPTLLVSGASSGASLLNNAVLEMLPDLLKVCQVVHLSGRRDEARMRSERESMPPGLRERYFVFGYLHDEMAQALAAADLAVMRSGASTLGELAAARLPAVLVPGEYEGWDQSPNALFLEQQGAALMLRQSRIDELGLIVLDLLRDGERRRRMQEALTRLARPEAARILAGTLMEMAGLPQRVAA